jgi:hypothetical protein
VRFRNVAGLCTVFALLLTLPALASAQAAPATSYGVKAGLNISSVKVDFGDASITGDGRAGFLFGGWVARDFNPRFGIQVEGLFSQKGTEFADEDNLFEVPGDASFKLSYIEFPVLARVNFPASAATVRVLAGPTFGFNVNESIKIGDDVELDGDDVPLKAFEAGFALGAAVEFRKFIVDARYTWGLTDINDNDDFDATVKNGTFSISFGYRFR